MSDHWTEYESLVRRVADEIRFDAIEQPDEGDDIEAVRESLIRHRCAAAAERQAHRARAVVCDVYLNDDLTAARMVVASPTGDRNEERELMIEAQAAARFVATACAIELEHARLVCWLFSWLLGGDE